MQSIHPQHNQSNFNTLDNTVRLPSIKRSLPRQASIGDVTVETDHSPMTLKAKHHSLVKPSEQNLNFTLKSMALSKTIKIGDLSKKEKKSTKAESGAQSVVFENKGQAS